MILLIALQREPYMPGNDYPGTMQVERPSAARIRFASTMRMRALAGRRAAPSPWFPFVEGMDMTESRAGVGCTEVTGCAGASTGF